MVETISHFQHKMRVLVLGYGLTYVHFKLALKEFEGCLLYTSDAADE